jgi:hypothetical protein
MSMDSLFETLGAVYGGRFTHQWPVEALPTVKAAWNRELLPFVENPAAIQYAVDNLPADHIPNVLEIRDMCRRFVNPSRSPRFKPLSEEEQQHALGILGSIQRPGPQDARAWARRLRARELAGERLTRYQRSAWREAINSQE